MSSEISEIIARGELPPDPSTLLSFLLDSNGKFIGQEGQTWDFKDSWPFSYSDAYFGGICRLICSFANTSGGIVIFGVDDKSREAGRNKVNPNVDRLQQAFRQLTGASAPIALRRYDAEVGSFDALLVLPILSTEQPLRFLKPVDKYPPNVVWVRHGHETEAAEPRDISVLYCRAHAAEEAGNLGVDGQLPPSTATIKRFIGRMETIDRIFYWLKKSDEPRAFLYGKGGSGKSTIAYEVTKAIKNEGAAFRIHENCQLDRVIFLSAKQKSLNTESQSQEKFVGLDFSNERELYEGILILSERDIASLDNVPIEQLKSEVAKFLNETSCFIVIDDIDTLTTKGLEAGFDFLIGALWRAKKRSKILYTLRNLPTQSLANSIEVPGLNIDGEYDEFVKQCAAQFSVPLPENSFISGTLASLSERRPLVVESIIALRRYSGSYKAAAELFESKSGDDVRSYVFEREWNALSSASKGREILAILAQYRDPMGFADLCALAQMDQSRVKDALTEVQEMFLQVDHSGNETSYRIGDLTRTFVTEASKALDFFQTIRTRVEKYKTTFYPDNPEISRLMSQVERNIDISRRTGNSRPLEETWKYVTTAKFTPAVSEDPRFLSIKGYVAILQKQPLLADARSLFQRAFAMKYSPDVRFVREWFQSERRGDMGDVHTAQILELVLQARGYSEPERIEFISRRAEFLFFLARDGVHVEPERSLVRLREALRLHVVAYRLNVEISSTSLSRCEEYCTNTAYTLVQFLDRAGRGPEFIDTVRQLEASRCAIDALEAPIAYFIDTVLSKSTTKSDLHKAANRIGVLLDGLRNKELWISPEYQKRTIENCEAASRQFRERANKL